jgi:hypothetical protein
MEISRIKRFHFMVWRAGICHWFITSGRRGTFGSTEGAFVVFYGGRKAFLATKYCHIMGHLILAIWKFYVGSQAKGSGQVRDEKQDCWIGYLEST